MVERVVDYRLRIAGAISLLKMGYTIAAQHVLAGEGWPSIDEAQLMQHAHPLDAVDNGNVELQP